MVLKKLLKKESEKEIRERVLSFAKDSDCGMIQPPMNAQDALDELARHLLGSGYYIVNPVNKEQANTQIVYDIEMKYKRVQ
jgi:hypothetical protein